MSRFAALVVLAATSEGVAAAPPTAEQVAARHLRATSIGRDPCRDPAGDEIVVCGRRESPYRLPGYDPMAGDDASQAGGNREGAMQRMKDTGAPCRARADPCIRGKILIRLRF